MTLTTEIGLVKTEIASSLAASLYTAKDLVYVAKAIEALAAAETTTGVFETADINSILFVGPNADTFNSAAGLTNPVIVAQINNNDYAQIAFKNTNSGTNASTDFIAYSNNGTDSDGYIDMGITSQNFTDPNFTITGKGDGYIFMVGASGGTDQGNLVLATGDTGSQNKIIFAAGGLASDDSQMVIIPNDRVHIEIPTPSTSPSTGALTVVGGVGIQGDVNIQGAITFGGAGTTVETANLAVTDPLVFVGNANAGDAVDLGIIAEYSTSISPITRTVSNKALTSNVATITTSAAHTFSVGDYVVVSSVDATFNGTYLVASVPTSTTFTYAKTATNVASAAATGSAVVSSKRRFGGIVRDASDGKTKIFEDATVKPSATVNFSEAGLVYGDLQVGPLIASSAAIGNVSNTELQYLDGVTSAIQTQLNTKAVYPDQASNSGRYLTTNGTATSWGTPKEVPSVSTTTLSSATSFASPANGGVVLNVGSGSFYLSQYGSYTQSDADIFNTAFPVGSVVTATSSTQTGTFTITQAATINGGGYIITNNITTSEASTIFFSGATTLSATTAGKYLTNNGTATYWATVDALPAQANKSGYYLTTNGTTATWAAIVTDPTPQIFMLMGA